MGAGLEGGEVCLDRREPRRGGHRMPCDPGVFGSRARLSDRYGDVRPGPQARRRWCRLGDNGYLEDADWPSDIDGRYSREEIAEEVEWLDDFDAKTGSPSAFDLASLVQPGERIADYTISGTGTNWGAPSYQCIVEEGSTDIHAALEDTMHRIIDARAATGDAVDVLRETTRRNARSVRRRRRRREPDRP